MANAFSNPDPNFPQDFSGPIVVITQQDLLELQELEERRSLAAIELCDANERALPFWNLTLDEVMRPEYSQGFCEVTDLCCRALTGVSKAEREWYATRSRILGMLSSAWLIEPGRLSVRIEKGELVLCQRETPAEDSMF